MAFVRSPDLFVQHITRANSLSHIARSNAGTANDRKPELTATDDRAAGVPKVLSGRPLRLNKGRNRRARGTIPVFCHVDALHFAAGRHDSGFVKCCPLANVGEVSLPRALYPPQQPLQLAVDKSPGAAQ